MHTYMYNVVHHWAEVISATPVSIWLQDRLWVIPTSQSIHILAISVVFASAIMINLRLLGVGARGRSVSQLSHTALPWLWGGLIVLLLTGILQTLVEPVRQFVTPAFWAKMTLIVLVATMTALYARAVRRNAARWTRMRGLRTPRREAPTAPCPMAWMASRHTTKLASASERTGVKCRGW